MSGFASVRWLADRCPWEREDHELSRALAFLGWDVSASDLLRAGDVAGIAVAGVVGLSGAAVGGGPATLAAAALAGLALPAGVAYGPRLLATARRTRALGAVPGVVSRAVMRMRLSPAPEVAASFAAETGRGRLADSLAAHVARADGRARTGLQSFADEWAEWFPSLRRAVTLVESAGRVPAEERTRTLDGALRVTLEGTRETMAEFAAAVRGPATAIYAFGVLLPLALVAMVPAAGTVGVTVSLATVVLVYDVTLPVVLLVVSGWLLARRPVAFPPPRVTSAHPDVPDRRLVAVAAGVATAGVAGVPTARHAPSWMAALAGAGIGTGAALVVYYRPMAAVRAEVRAVEDGLSDALYLVGREVQRGRAVETAMDEAARTLDGATGDVLADATRRQRQLKVGVRESLLTGSGALATVPSERTRGTAELLALAASEGRPAGGAIVAIADHLDDLRTVERDVRRDLRRVTGTLANTGSVFGPLVGGATVTLAQRMTADGPLASGGVPADALGQAVGVYVLVLAVLLTALATGLERGLDRSLVGYRVGRALLTATATFVLAAVASGALI